MTDIRRDVLDLQIANKAYVSIRKISGNNVNSALGGMDLWATSAAHHGKTHCFLMRYVDGQATRLWSLEWNPAGIVSRSGDLEAMERDMALLRMFLF